MVAIYHQTEYSLIHLSIYLPIEYNTIFHMITLVSLSSIFCCCSFFLLFINCNPLNLSSLNTDFVWEIVARLPRIGSFLLWFFFFRASLIRVLVFWMISWTFLKNASSGREEKISNIDCWYSLKERKKENRDKYRLI